MNNKIDGATVTEAHRKLAADLCRSATGSNRAIHHVPQFAQLIADSEALACAKLRAEVRAVLKIVNEQTARAELAEAEVDRLREQQIADAKSANESIAFLKARAIRAEAKLKSLVDSF